MIQDRGLRNSYIGLDSMEKADTFTLCLGFSKLQFAGVFNLEFAFTIMTDLEKINK